MENYKSSISNLDFTKDEIVLGINIRDSIFRLIQEEHPNFDRNSQIAVSELNSYRQKYLENYLLKDAAELSELEKDVLKSMTTHEMISKKPDKLENNTYTFGEKLADKVASFGGSWKFIMIFGVFIIIWMIINIVFLSEQGFDPYPFILLNLILSCLAALQAPVIMMSQNRQEDKDRERSKQDYMINMKAELEIRTLHEKMDHLVIQQQEELMKIQQIQLEMMEDIMDQIKDLKSES